MQEFDSLKNERDDLPRQLQVSRSDRSNYRNVMRLRSHKITGAIAFGYLVDNDRYRRSVKAKAYWVMLLLLATIAWGTGLAWQLRILDRETWTRFCFRS